MDLSDARSIVDWSHEREWCFNGDYSFEYEDIEVIVATPEYYRKLVNWCMEEGHQGILQKINGIIVLNSIYN